METIQDKVIVGDSPPKGIISFVLDVIRWNLSGGIGYQLYLCALAALVMLGVFAYSVQTKMGLAATNMSDIVSWGFYIGNFTFLVGVAAAAVMLILPAYMFRDKDLHKVVIIGEGVANGALVMCLLFIIADTGGPHEAVAFDTGDRDIQLAFIAAHLGHHRPERIPGPESAGARLYPLLSIQRS